MNLKNRIALVVILTAWSISSPLRAQIITTVVGSTEIGDGGPAAQATVNPTGITVDANGNVYIAEQENHRVRKVSPGGIITTVAGTGIVGLSGDGGAATSAKLTSPRSVAVDAAGNLYIADYGNNRIRRVSTTGIITTVAGSNHGFSGDGGPATAAQLAFPNGIALDAAGNLYIADLNNSRLRKVDTNGIITTIAGTGVAGFSGDGGPATSAQFGAVWAVAVGPDGSLFVACPEYNNCRVRKIAPDGIVTTIAGTTACDYAGDGGAATSASLNIPHDVAVDGAGNVLVAELGSHRIRRIATNGLISTVAGFNGYGYSGDGGAATAASLASPVAVAVDGSGKIYIADRDNGRVRVISSAGIISTLAGPSNAGFGGDGGPATSARINYPTDVKAVSDGSYFIADHGNNRVRKVNADGLISTVAGVGSSGFSGDGGLATQAQLNGVHSVLPDGNGNLLIADAFNNRIRKVNAAGIISTIVGSPIYGFSGDGGPATSAALRTPYALALDNSGILYITDSNNHRIRRIGADGVITTVVGTGTPGFSGDGGPATSAQINFPTGVGFDAANNLYIADNKNHRIRRVSPAGIISTVAGNGIQGFSGENGLATAARIGFPWKITVSASGEVFFSDNDNRVRRIRTDGTINTVAGTSVRGFSGDGGAANRAKLNGPLGMGLDDAGNILIADANNARIRKVSCFNPPVVTIAASSTNVCVGDEITLTASVAGNPANLSYTWSSNTIPKTVNTASLTAVPGSNSYSVTVTTVTGCTTTASGSFTAAQLISVKSGDWHDSATWSCGRVPSGKDAVTISNGHSVTILQIAEAKDLVLNGNLSYGSGGSLFLGGTQSPFAALDAAIANKMNQHGIPGVSIAVVRNEKLVYLKSYGYADLENNELASNDNLWRLASVSKPVTAIAILKLVQDGVIAMNQKVFGTNGILGNDYGQVPAGSNKDQITVRHLLDHKSGWTNTPDDPMFLPFSWTQTQIITEVLTNRPLAYLPGTTDYYSNFGYCLLGRIIEKVTQKTYESYVQTAILNPMGIMKMRIGKSTLADRLPDEVKYYQDPPSPYSMNITRMDSPGGWIASAKDLAKFIVRIDRLNQVPDIVPASLLNQFYFGYQAWLHYGSLPGTSTALFRLDDTFSYVVLANTRNESAVFDVNTELRDTMTAQIRAIGTWPNYDLFD